VKSHHFAVLLAAVAALAGGLLISTHLHEPAGQQAKTQQDASGETVLAAAFPDLNGQRQPLSQWKGKVLVVNFWATWCPPCREEIPGFIALQRELSEKDVQFVGIAMDQADKVNNFARGLGVNYPLLLGEDSAFELQSRLGNTSAVLPFTVVIDSAGKLITRHAGGLRIDQLRSTLLPLTLHP
jgi:thiol-disulfide isomerase/thioredoxin